ncbi:MAG: hypothetical protein QF775_02285 [archaeon]|jgi:hypothetical protein|nr:hypothetical protein [Euryarchaeota archaeon]MDP6704290.1 hypothetical protein [archaeon]|tara:strand:- start:3550 stop:3990 length:441 start_codon:yes stop_codon:yes gene_type:complete
MATARQTQKQVDVSDFEWRLNALMTKVRINEQNVINERKHAQLLNKNLIDFKGELRGKIDSITQQNRELKLSVNRVKEQMKTLTKKLKDLPSKAELNELRRIQESATLYGKDLSKDEADDILDKVLSQIESRETGKENGTTEEKEE